MDKVVLDLNNNRHVISVDADLVWLWPYVMAAKKRGMPVWRIEAIKGYSVPLDKAERQDAALLRDGGHPNRKMVITILKNRQRWSYARTQVGTSGYVAANKGRLFEYTLNSLAHELSHIFFWEHTADRFVLESKLMICFARLAKRRGYKGYKG